MSRPEPRGVAMALARVRSVVGFVALVLWFVPQTILAQLYLWPAVQLFPSRRLRIVSLFMKFCSHSLLGLMRFGGGRYRLVGTIPTEQPVLVVANHQSLLDILAITLMSQPNVPAFVTRSRYGRWIPTVSMCIRLLDCPLIDPRDRHSALRAMGEHAQRGRNGSIIFPEGHRSRDGSVLPFKTAGIEMVLRTRRMPVYLVVTDGAWVCRRFVDFVFNMHRIDGHAEVFGPFEPPDDDIAAFVAGLRERAVAEVARYRGNEAAA